jgi:hypothetical protein
MLTQTFHFSFGEAMDERPPQQEGNWAPVSTLLTRVNTHAGTAFGMQDDDLAVRIRHEIGIESMTWGTDFPHVASDWPHTTALIDRMFDGVPEEDARKILGGNLAAHLKLEESLTPA